MLSCSSVQLFSLITAYNWFLKRKEKLATPKEGAAVPLHPGKGTASVAVSADIVCCATAGQCLAVAVSADALYCVTAGQPTSNY